MHFVTTVLNVARLVYSRIQWERLKGSNNSAANCRSTEQPKKRFQGEPRQTETSHPIFFETVQGKFATTIVSKIIGPLEFFPLDPIVNMSCNVECCGKKMQQIVANMMLCQ